MLHNRTLLFSTLVLAIAGIRPAVAADSDARIVTANAGGLTRHNRLMPWRPVGQGGKVPDIVQVSCEKRCVVQADADNTVELEPGAIISLRDHLFVPLFPVSPMIRARQVELVDGNVRIVSARGERSRPIVVMHEGAYIALRGGEGRLMSRGDSLVVSTVGTEGRVAVRRGWSTLEADHTMVLGPNGKSAPRHNLAAPAWNFDAAACEQPVALALQGRPATVGLCWKPVPDAATYRVEFSADPTFETTSEVLNIPTTTWQAERKAGHSFARVRAVDEHGMPSDPTSLRGSGVIPVELPAGSILDPAHRVLVIPEGSEVEFNDAANAEMAIDNGRYQPVPTSLGVRGEALRKLVFRYRGDATPGGSYDLERRNLRAKIQILPREARWPKDPVDIVVTLEDPSGRWDPQRLQPNLEVLLGRMSTNLEWTQAGASWKAHLPPRDMGAPTVVRVIATDEFGHLLGRNFLEVDYTPRPASAKLTGLGRRP